MEGSSGGERTDRDKEVLALLITKADELLTTFDLLPADLQMDGLDILQGIVTKTVRKITQGKVSSVKFIPVQENKKTPTHPPLPTACQENVVSNSDLKQEQVSEGDGPCDGEERGNHLPADPDPMIKDSPAQTPPSGGELSPPDAPTLQPHLDDGVNTEAESSPPFSLVLSETEEMEQGGGGEGCALPVFVGSGRRAALVAAARLKEDTLSEDGSQPSLGDTSQEMVFPSGVETDGMSEADPEVPEQKGGKWHDGGWGLRCRYCAYHCDTETQLSSHHALVHSGSRLYECEYCNSKFSAVSSLKRHKATHSGEKRFECPVCGKAFYTAAQCQVHSVVHTEQRMYACSQCTKCYTNPANLRRHCRIHTGEMPYACPHCDVRFRDFSSLKLHKLKHTGEKPYTCEICNKQFKTSSDYRRHERIHTGERKYKCPDCGKMFIQGWHLKQHSKMHNNDRPWSCERCGKAFRTKASLQFHTRSHLGIKNFKCPICKKSFSTKKYLQNHQVVHTRAQPYACSVCGVRFNQYPNMKRHERVHSDQKPYVCKMCGKKFKYINSLQYHEGAHRGQRSLCPRCGLAFRSKAGLRHHRCDPTTYTQNLLRTVSRRTPVVRLEALDPRLLNTGEVEACVSEETTPLPAVVSTAAAAPTDHAAHPPIVLKINKGKLNRGNLSKRRKIRKGKIDKIRLAKKTQVKNLHGKEFPAEPAIKRKRGRPRKVPVRAEAERRVPPITIRTETTCSAPTQRSPPVPVQLFSRIYIPPDVAGPSEGWAGDCTMPLGSASNLTDLSSQGPVVIKEEAEGDGYCLNASGSTDESSVNPKLESQGAMETGGARCHSDVDLMKAAYS